MEYTKDYIEVKSNEKVSAKKGVNTRVPYNHQKEAMRKLSIINSEPSFSTLVVLPTGGGKTYTATTWLLKNAIDQKKKILWIAHRQFLLDQAENHFRNLLMLKISLIFQSLHIVLFLEQLVMTGLLI